MLTKREIEILKLRKKGMNQKEIAKKLNIKQPSVSLFESNIRRKLKESANISDLLKEMEIKYDKKNGEVKF